MIKKISSLQILTWDGAKKTSGSPLPHIEQVQQLLDAGADWIQLRQKQGTEAEKLKTAIQAVELCEKHNAILIINDSPQIALESGASGVHLGLKDCSVAEARNFFEIEGSTRDFLTQKRIIGGTSNTQLQVLQRVRENCDYIGLGPFRTTSTKENLSEVLGLSGIKGILDSFKFAASGASSPAITEHFSSVMPPVIAIGAIMPEDVPDLLKIGVYGVAVSSAVVAAPNIKEAFLKFKKVIEIAKQNPQ